MNLTKRKTRSASEKPLNPRYRRVGRRRLHPAAPRWFSQASVVEYDDPPAAPTWIVRGDPLPVETVAPAAEPGSQRDSEVQDFIRLHLGADDGNAKVIWSIRRDWVQGLKAGWRALGVLQKVNNSRWISKYFRAVNSRLMVGGTFVGCLEENKQRKQRLLGRYPVPLGHISYYMDCLVHRVWPKLPFLKKAYFTLTRGHNRPISVVEVLGRLVSCGFEIIEHREIGQLTYFAVRKVREATVVRGPTYGPVCTLKRMGKGESPFTVYKLRTMHPYAEFLQDYVYKLNDLADGGKFRNDFRIPSWGKWMRRLWLDELPMIYNFLKGEMKLVGVRPLSLHYFSLYPPELQELRKRHTPGLIPPFYADLPATFEEIVESELKYLRAYENAPLRTDVRYFVIGAWNILVKRARSA